MTEDYFGTTEPWVKHRTSKIERLMSNDEAISTYEDLQESPVPMSYDRSRGEWAFNIIQSTGFPRQRLGTLFIRLTDEGKIVLSLE